MDMMKTMLAALLSAAMAGTSFAAAPAGTRLARVFADNMVLQRDKAVRV